MKQKYGPEWRAQMEIKFTKKELIELLRKMILRMNDLEDKINGLKLKEIDL